MTRARTMMAGAAVAVALTMGGATAASADWAPRYAAPYKASTARAIDVGMGAPTGWSRALSPVKVRQALTRPTVTARVNRLDRAIRAEARRYDVPLSMARDVIVCDVAYVDGGEAQDQCYSGIETRYYRYL